MQDPLKGRRLLLERISDAANTAPDALARIALYIVNDPEAVLTLSIADFAHDARSGSASVIRFCRMLGFSGFREFRIALCSEIERRKAFQLAKRAAPKDVSLSPRVASLATALQDSIVASARAFDDLQICDLAKRVRAARRVEVFGTGPSSICADILATRLIWLGLPVHSSGSASMAHGLARALDPSSVAIGISLLGHNEETKNFLNIARKTGAYTIAISSRASGEVAEAADEVILFSPVGAWRVPGSAMHVPSVVLLTEYLCLCLEEAEALRSDQ